MQGQLLAGTATTRASALLWRRAAHVQHRQSLQLCHAVHPDVTESAASSSGSRASSSQGASTSGSDNSFPHVPVMLRQVLDALGPGPIKLYVDGTLGAGGHSSAVMQTHPVRAEGAA